MSRTADEIYLDIVMVSATGADGSRRAERVHALWDELARVVTKDRDVPPWASLAAMLVRDQYARDLAADRAGTTESCGTRES